MADDLTTSAGTTTSIEEVCAQCGKRLTPDDRVAAGGKLFCRSCYADLRAQLEQVVTQMSSDIPWVNATLGALLGGVAGILVWWGFTVVTKMSFGLIAVGIGFAVGWGTVRFAGGKRSSGLQALSVTVAALSYAVATYLVNMTFMNRALVEQGKAYRVAFPPQSLEIAGMVLASGFGVMDVVFLAIVIYEAWKLPRPIVLPSRPIA
jgi:hypothetical protein